MAQLQAIPQQDLSKGVNLVSNPYIIGQQQSTLLINFLLDEHGSIRVRDGTRILTSSPDVAPNIRPIVKLFDYVKQDLTTIPLVILLGIGVGNNSLWNRETDPWTLIGILGTQYNIPDMLTFTDLCLIANGYETPWCVDTETEALTPTGWKRHNALQAGDTILAYDPKSKTSRWAPMLGKYEGHFTGDVTVARWHGRDVAVSTPEHRWMVERNGFHREKTSEELSKPRNTKRPDANFGIPIAARLEEDIAETVGDDLIRLIGWVVAEGSVAVKGNGVSMVVYQSPHSPHEPEVDRVCRLFGASRRSMADEDVWQIPAKAGHLVLAAIEHRPFKRPRHEFVARLSLRQRELLFDTICQGDGSMDLGSGQDRKAWIGRWRLSQHRDSRLLDDLQGWLFACGIPTSLPPYVCPGTTALVKNSAGCRRLYGLIRPYIRPAWRREPFDGPVWCPQVETGWWVARRNGMAYVTGNSYDGTTLQHLTDPSGNPPAGAKHHTLHQGYYWVWNTAKISTTADGNSSLRSSDLNDPNSWPLANQIFVDKDDGDVGMGMGQFTIAETGISPTTSQILFKRRSAYQMTGVFGSTNPAFAIQKTKSDMGCVAPRTIHFAPGFGLIRLTERGFALFDGVDDKLISEEVRPLIFGSDVFQAVDWEHIDGAYAEVVENPPLYLAFCPVSGAGLTRVFCYDLVRRAWTILQYPFPVSTVALHYHTDAPPHLLLGDFDDGHIRHTFSSESDDDGAPIAWQVQPRSVSVGSPQTNAYFRRFIMKVITVRQGQQIGALVIFGPNTNGTPRQIAKTIIIPATVGLGLGWGIQPWGTSAWGGVQINTEMDLTMDLGLIGTNARAVLTGQGPIRFRGLEWHARAKPLRRVMMFQ